MFFVLLHSFHLIPLYQFNKGYSASDKNGTIKEHHLRKKPTGMQERTDGESLVLSGETYHRSHSPQLEALRIALMIGYGCYRCVVTSSGLASISAVIHGILASRGFNKKMNIVYSSELYRGTPNMLQYIARLYPTIKLHTVDVRESEPIVSLFERKLRKKDTILLFESCSNPNGYIFDFSIIPRLRAASNALFVVVDNTWLTEVVFNPLKHGADFVITSLTKYHSAGTAIGGAVLGNQPEMTDIREWVRLNGQHTSPHNCQLIAENYKTMAARIKASSILTKQIIDFMVSETKFGPVSYPLLQGHPSYNLAIKYFAEDQGVKLTPSVFTFHVKAAKTIVKMKLEENSIIEHKTSFGGKLSRIDPYPFGTDEFTICRLSLGYDDQYDRVINGLKELALNI